MTHPNFIEFLDSALEIGRLKTVLDETGEAKLSVPVGFCPLILSKLRESFTCLYIARDEIEAEAIFESLNSLGVQAVFFPDIDVIPYSNVFPSSDKLSDRINTLYKLTAPEPGIAVLTAESFIRKLPPKKYFDKSIRRYRVGSRIDREELTALLVRFSYIREAKVTAQGGFAIRGDIIDIFPPNYSEGVRISLFGDEIESIFRSGYGPSLFVRVLGGSRRRYASLGDVIVVAMRDEDVPQLERVFRDGIQNGLRLPPGVEQRRLAGSLIPDQVTVHRIAPVRRHYRPQLAPAAQIHFLERFPDFRLVRDIRAGGKGQGPVGGQGGKRFAGMGDRFQVRPILHRSRILREIPHEGVAPIEENAAPGLAVGE